MIVDRIENAHLYYGIAPHIDAALRFLQEGKLDNIAQLSITMATLKSAAPNTPPAAVNSAKTRTIENLRTSTSAWRAWMYWATTTSGK